LHHNGTKKKQALKKGAKTAKNGFKLKKNDRKITTHKKPI